MRIWNSLKPIKLSSIKPGTKVFLRLDLNVPVKDGYFLDAPSVGRVAQSIPIIRSLRNRGAIVCIATHLSDPKTSTRSSAAALSRWLQFSVQHLPGSPSAWSKKLSGASTGSVFFLDNLRSFAGEDTNDRNFARSLAAPFDLYINNAFGVCHRNHASVSAIRKFLPSFIGPLISSEVAELGSILRRPGKCALVLGGAKISTKLPLLKKMIKTSDLILLGGAIALEVDQNPALKKLLSSSRAKLFLPIDYRKENGKAVDIGPKTVKLFKRSLTGVSNLIWNGPMGIVERPYGRRGTLALARAVTSYRGLHSVIGGGDTVTALASSGTLPLFSFVSTGGGAMIAFLAGERMPGVEG